MITLILIAVFAALIFGLLGFTGIAKGFAAIAKILFYIFLTLFVIILIFNLLA